MTWASDCSTKSKTSNNQQVGHHINILIASLKQLRIRGDKYSLTMATYQIFYLFREKNHDAILK